MNHRLLPQLFVILGTLAWHCLMVTALAAQQDPAAPRYWKGNLHTHSLWSDGNDFPEMIALWYRQRGYHFLALSDHNILSRGEKWMPLTTIEKRGGPTCFPKYQAAMPEDWIEARDESTGSDSPDGEEPDTTVRQIRLKTLAEVRSLVEEPGTFIMLKGEEISDSVDRKPVHMNATNLQHYLPPLGGSTVREAIGNNLRAAQQQARDTNREILVHVNHPNFGWAVTARDLAFVTEEKFFEIFNGHPSVNQLGDKQHLPIEKMWDVINAYRLLELNAAPIFGLGVDDSHHYHGRNSSQPGRAWVMVKSPTLSADALLKAMNRGDFYASSGVTLDAVEFDRQNGRLSLKIEPEPGVSYQTHFIGTRKDLKQMHAANANPQSPSPQYSEQIGITLKTESGLNPSYQLSGDELYVRALVVSSKPHPNPTVDNQMEQAWTQPVGWRTE